MGSPELWACDTAARTLRVELPRQEIFILPLTHFLHAEVKAGMGEIRAVFVTHEITIRGRNLRRIVAALARKELSFVTISPPAHNVPEGQTIIREILVSEVKKPEAAKPGETAAS